MKRSLGAKTIVYPTPVFVVGSYDANGQPNVMTAAWGGICCSKPPCVTISLRKATYTYANIMAQKAYTISIAPASHAKEADYFGIVSGKDVDKFAAAGLTPVRSDVVNAPYIKEFPLVVECTLLKTVEIGLHTQFIGEIVDVKADESVIDPDGHPDVEKIMPISYAPETMAYHRLGAFVGKAFSIGKEI